MLDKPKRILMTADTVGGVWTYALELAGALRPFGVEIALATMGAPVSAPQRRELRALPHVELFESAYRLEWMQDPWRDVATAGEWLLSLEDRVRPDLVHLNGYAHAVLPWDVPRVVIAHSCVVSWWRAVHGCDAPPEWNRYREAVGTGLRSAEMVIAPSGAMLQAVLQNYGKLASFHIIPNSRSVPPWNGDGIPAGAAREPFILSAGRIWDGAKNISALTGIADSLPWPVYVAGDKHVPNRRPEGSSPNSVTWRGAVDKSHSPEPGTGVRHLGRLSSEELWTWMFRASIFALPARYEPFGLSALEAGLAGCSLVLGDIPSLREIWDDAAVFVPPDDVERLASVLRDLTASPLKRELLGAKARRRAAIFSPTRMAKLYLLAYGEAMLRHRDERSLPKHRPADSPEGSARVVEGQAAATLSAVRKEVLPCAS
jgi:glycogen synthase